MSGYRTASAVPTVLADPALLASDAVRCLWVRPIEGRFLPSVIFKDGTDCPLACHMEELPARQFCQRISAVHDWPVIDHLPRDIGPEVAAEKIWATMPPDFKAEIDGQTCVNAEGIGYMMADMCREYVLPLGLAVARVTERIGSFTAAMVAQGVMDEASGREWAKRVAEAAVIRLGEIYPGEERGSSFHALSPGELGVVLADYNQSRGSDDAHFQHSLSAAMTAAMEVWTDEGMVEEAAKARVHETMDAAIQHWFRITGRAVKGDAR